MVRRQALKPGLVRDLLAAVPYRNLPASRTRSPRPGATSFDAGTSSGTPVASGPGTCDPPQATQPEAPISASRTLRASGTA